MAAFFYSVFIFPLEGALRFLLVYLYQIFQSYGMAIILLSLLVNVFLLKIFILTDKKSEYENQRKKILDARIQNWKKVYNKTKVFAFTQRLYKQEHYHPIFALSALGGLFIQIPFFYAMYFVIQNNLALNAVSFLWIKDLSAPDLIFGVHLLPILMTLISLINVFISAKENSARIQGALISFLFLYLLYNMPSALVLYWTCNMLFSLIKNTLIQFKFKFKKNKINTIKEQNNEKTNFVDFIDCIHFFHLKSFLKDFFKLPKIFKWCFVACFSILTLALISAGIIALTTQNKNQTATVTYINAETAKIHHAKSLRFLLRSNSLSDIHIQNIQWNENIHPQQIQNVYPKGRYLNFSYSHASHSFKEGDEIANITYQFSLMPLFKNAAIMYFVLFTMVVFTMRGVGIFKQIQNNHIPNSIYTKIKFYALLNICFLICIFNTFMLYQSDLSQFDADYTFSTLSALLGAFVLSFFFLHYILSFIPKKYTLILSFVLTFILLIALLNTFILVGDYGAMDRFVFQKELPDFLNPNLYVAQYKTFLMVFIIGIFVVCLTLEKLLTPLKIILFSLIIISGMHLGKIVYPLVMQQQPSPPPPNLHNQAENTSENTVLPYENELFSYSKTKSNVVVFMLDMFSGSHMPALLKEYPQLKEQLEGFTFFPNAVASANATEYTMPSVVGGEYYTIYNSNLRGDLRQNTTVNAFQNIAHSFLKNDYQVSFLMYYLGNKQELFKTLYDNPQFNQQFHWVDNRQAFKPYFLEKHPHLVQNKTHASDDIVKLLSFSLFKITPEIYKKHIYKHGMWLYNNPVDANSIINSAAMLYAPTHIGNVNAQKPTFKFFYSGLTHAPYGIFFNNNTCHYFSSGSTWKGGEIRWYMNQHWDTELCALSYLNDYLQWLKKENIFDNTQIFVVSDHSGDRDSINIPELFPRLIGQDVLLLFKDFNQQGALQIDQRLMSNFDLASIYCDQLKTSCPNVPPSILKNYPANRTLIHVRPNDDFNHHLPNAWLIDKAYQISGNDITNPKNYQDISQSSPFVNNKK